MDIKKEIKELSDELFKHQRLYYIEATPEISDTAYDALFDKLLELEEKYPEYALPNSPTKRVGSDLDNDFPEHTHTIPVLSLDKEYTTEGLEKWIAKTIKNTGSDLSFVVEEKIDGASIVLYYKNGRLESGVTRGNGLVGNAVTENIRTINEIPLVIKDTSDFAVRGEIFIDKKDFETYNKTFDDKYSNPRNLAAGSMRNIRSSVVAKVPLNIFTYEGFFDESDTNDHIFLLSHLKENGFKINKNMGFFSDDPAKRDEVREKLPEIRIDGIDKVAEYVKERAEARDALGHEIDGLVLKVNEIDVRNSLGYTSHHPRWAIAFKFDSPKAQTRLIDIDIQVGRNGRISPVGNLEPVKIAGSTVARATLHNQEYIEMLELGPGDLVSISKRGDVIPAVEEVLEKNEENPSTFKFPTECPHCKSTLEKDGAHHFCKNRECPERVKRSIIFFAAKGQMDMDTMGGKTIGFLFDKGFVTTIPQLYTYDYDGLLEEEGFKERKVNNIKNSVLESKKMPFHKVLRGLGFDGVGKSAIGDLIANGYNSVDKIIAAAEAEDVETFSDIEGFGEITGRLIIEHFTDAANLETIKQLKESGLNFEEEVPEEAEEVDTSGLAMHGQVWVITGTFENFAPRSKAAEEIKKRGGTIGSSVSSKTTHLLAGAAAGSKKKKAEKQGIPILDEAAFLDLIK
ncbi:MAG: DNA ligase (NAD(+)) LigA [bacterium]|nr:DNA ligase (NAD(+)) LigA [bacterium]